jgi:hypothetical protein
MLRAHEAISAASEISTPVVNSPHGLTSTAPVAIDPWAL